MFFFPIFQVFRDHAFRYVYINSMFVIRYVYINSMFVIRYAYINSMFVIRHVYINSRQFSCLLIV